MKISNKQVIMLLEILRATLGISNLSTYDSKQRIDLYNQIVNQQDCDLVDLSNDGDVKASTVLPIRVLDRP